jgi:hypothetical protein
MARNQNNSPDCGARAVDLNLADAMPERRKLQASGVSIKINSALRPICPSMPKSADGAGSGHPRGAVPRVLAKYDPFGSIADMMASHRFVFIMPKADIVF